MDRDITIDPMNKDDEGYVEYDFVKTTVDEDKEALRKAKRPPNISMDEWVKLSIDK